MTTRRYATPNTVETVLSTELNGLAQGTVALSAAIDNSSGLYLWADFEICTPAQGSSALGTFDSLYLVESIDGTNFEDAVLSTYNYGTSSGSGFGLIAQLIGAIKIPNGSTSTRKVLRHIKIPPSKFKVAYIQARGAALPGSGNTIKMIRYAEQNA